MSGVSVITREHLERLEAEVAKLPQVDCPLRHLFAPGVYIREMTIPAGNVAVGAVHKTEHATFVHGHCLITTDEGLKEIHGYASFISRAGIKRACTAIGDTVVTTVHPTTETDLDKLCLELTESTPDQLLGGANNRQLLANRKELPCLGDS